MIRNIKMLAKMFLDRREFKGTSEFRFHPRLFDQDGMIGVNVTPAEGEPFTAWMRPSTSDNLVFAQILLDNDYNLRRFPAHFPKIMDRYGRMANPLILDLGANIGLSALYFAKNFAKAQVVAMEPDPESFRVLQHNVRGFPKIVPMNVAVASRDARVVVIESNKGAWAHQTRISDDGHIPALSMPSILRMFSDQQPFLVKIDIEGAEEELFSGDIRWIENFSVVVIETHDWMLPGRAISKNFIKAISGLNRDLLIHGENVFSIAN
jgi:FkbM family methyltransferase